MKSYDYEAIVYEGAIYCVGPCSEGTDYDRDPEVAPIFADSEWDHYPVCAACGAEHTYVSLTDEGRRALAAPEVMVRAYLECAVWSSSDIDSDACESLEHLNYSADDFTAAADDQARKDCDDFWQANRADLAATGASAEQHGHDFWLTRNRHGAGFWDRGYAADLSRRLTEAAHAYGPCEVRIVNRANDGLGELDLS